MVHAKKNPRQPEAALVILIAALAAGGYFYWDLTKERNELTLTLSHTENKLDETFVEKEGLTERLEDEEEKVAALSGELRRLTGTVTVLEKLQNTDEELLKKYSKVYFLNEHYEPPTLTKIPEKYAAKENEEEVVHAKVWPYLEELLKDAADDDIELQIVSAFRSFEEQSELKAGYTVVYGSGANAFSADQGYSEHQLGTTVDLNTTAMGGSLDGFSSTEAYEWLQKNAHRYGFVLSYPQGNSYYIFEPWHWRYVGTTLATDLHKENAHFYDWDQRKIDKYLIDLFE